MWQKNFSHIANVLFGSFYSDYRVMLIDKNYLYALKRCDVYLWIFSRKPKLADDVRGNIQEEATQCGYGVS